MPGAGTPLSPGAQSYRTVAVKCLFANENMTPERLPTAHCPAAGEEQDGGGAGPVGLQGRSRLRQGKGRTEEEVQATGHSLWAVPAAGPGLLSVPHRLSCGVQSVLPGYSHTLQARAEPPAPQSVRRCSPVSPNLPHCPSPSSQSGPQLSIRVPSYTPGTGRGCRGCGQQQLASSKASFDKDTP